MDNWGIKSPCVHVEATRWTESITHRLCILRKEAAQLQISFDAPEGPVSGHGLECVFPQELLDTTAGIRCLVAEQMFFWGGGEA